MKGKVLKYSNESYVPQITIMRDLIMPISTGNKLRDRDYADSLIRKEYTRLRAIAVKRLKRLEGTEFEQDVPYQRYHNRVKKLAEFSNMSQVAKALSDLASFVSMETSTVTGAKAYQKRVLEGMRKHGVNFVDKDNLRSFSSFMQMLRIKLLDRIYDSERAYKVYTQARKLGLKWHGDLEKEFDFFYRNIKDMQELPKVRGFNASDYKKLILEWQEDRRIKREARKRRKNESNRKRK